MKKKTKKTKDFSKQLVGDVRNLLWIVTIGGLLLAFYCIYEKYLGTLPWIATMVGLPWSAHGVICSFYLNMAKADHSVGGITFEAAKAKEFQMPEQSENSPSI